MHYICTVCINSDQIMHCQLVFYVQTSQIMHICTAIIECTALIHSPMGKVQVQLYRTRVDVKGLRTLLHWMYPGTPTFALECGTCTPLDVPRYAYYGIQISEERPLL